MAATCLDIITLAMKQCRILASGGVPSAAETKDGMTAIQSLYDEWRTGGMFGTLADVYLTANDVAEEGKRYYTPVGITVTDATSDYYAGCDLTVRQPRDMALYEVVGVGSQRARLYDRTGWVDLLDLAPTSIAPLSGRGTIGLAASLATSGAFADVFGAQPGPGTVTSARHFLTNIMSKSGSTQDASPSEYF